MPAPVCLIVNPAAGGGRARRAAPLAEQALRSHGVAFTRADTRDLEHARELAGAAAARGEAVVALGGDGLIGAIADRLRHEPGAVLGVVPGGRGNDLARVLGIPEDTEQAVAIVAAGHTRALDLGVVEELEPAGGPGTGTGAAAPTDRAFVGIASAGFDSDANRIANEAPSWLGALVYAYGGLRALASWRPARFELQLEPQGERRAYEGFTVGAANSRAYGGGMMAAPSALLDDGQLEVLVVERMGKLAFVRKILLKVFDGSHVREPGVHVLRAREIELAADRPFAMYADGDPIGRLPVRVRALPGAIAVLVPDAPNAAFLER